MRVRSSSALQENVTSLKLIYQYFVYNVDIQSSSDDVERSSELSGSRRKPPPSIDGFCTRIVGTFAFKLPLKTKDENTVLVDM